MHSVTEMLLLSEKWATVHTVQCAWDNISASVFNTSFKLRSELALLGTDLLLLYQHKPYQAISFHKTMLFYYTHVLNLCSHAI